MADLSAAIIFAAVLPALLVAHNVADHWVQTHHQAVTKGTAGWRGRLACAKHVAIYTAVTAVTVLALWVAFGLPISILGFSAGQAVSAVSHYWADRRVPLRRLASTGVFGAIGKGDFWHVGTPREGHDDNPTLGTGAYALDQSWHWGWLGVAALITATL